MGIPWKMRKSNVEHPSLTHILADASKMETNDSASGMTSDTTQK